jgi:hypothetical protein
VSYLCRRLEKPHVAGGGRQSVTSRRSAEDGELVVVEAFRGRDRLLQHLKLGVAHGAMW